MNLEMFLSQKIKGVKLGPKKVQNEIIVNSYNLLYLLLHLKVSTDLTDEHMAGLTK